MAVALQIQQPVFDPPEVRKEVEVAYLEKPFLPITEVAVIEPSKPRFNHFTQGNCTFWVASKREIPWYGNAGEWLQNAQSAGYETGTTPKEGAIMVSNESPLGHVSYIEKVNDSDFTISEMNVRGLGVKSTRTLPLNFKLAKGFIYDKKI